MVAQNTGHHLLRGDLLQLNLESIYICDSLCTYFLYCVHIFFIMYIFIYYVHIYFIVYILCSLKCITQLNQK